MKHRLPLQQFLHRAAEHPEKVFLHQPDRGIWRTYTWGEVDHQARCIASALCAQGYTQGDRIAILAKNCAEWFIADIAIAMAGMISVPIYSTAGAETIEYVLEHSQARAIFVGKLDSLDAAQAGIGPHVLRITMPYPSVEARVGWGDWLDNHSPLRQVHEPAADDLMTLVYTSGSTGRPKGVELSCGNVAASADCAAERFNLAQTDRLVSYLPLAHITERCAVEWPAIYGGCEVFFTESLDTFNANVCYAQPTLFISVPRLWTKFQAEILARLPEARLKRLLRIPIVRTLIAKKIRKNLGLNSCRLFGSGSAPISPALIHWFSHLGINISEGWGMTETSGLACATIPFEEKLIGSIGRPLDSVEMKLADNNEILIRGPAVFSRYHLNPEATAESFTGDWFHTGDLGEIDEHGAYKIVGRAKEQFKTGKGKYVSPAPIENLLGRNPDIELVCVLGSGRKQPIAVVVLGEHLQMDSQDARAQVHERLTLTLHEANGNLESHEKLDHLIVSEEMWTVDNQLLTPTLKLRRRQLEERYGHLIDARLDELVVWRD